MEEDFPDDILGRARLDGLALCARFDAPTIYHLMREDALLYYRMVHRDARVANPEHDPRYYLHRALAMRDYLEAQHGESSGN